MSKFTKEVLEIGSRSKGQSHWTVIKVKGKTEGKTFDENVFDKELAKYLREHGTGVYEIEYEKNEGKDGKEYWNPTSATFVRKIDGGSKEQERVQEEKRQAEPAASATTTKTTEKPTIDPAVKLRAEIAAIAIQSAGVAAAAYFTKNGDKITVADLADHTAMIARTLMIEAREFINGPNKVAKPEPAPAGA